MKLYGFEVVRPPYEIDQDSLLNWMAQAHQEVYEMQETFVSASGSSGISTENQSRDFHRLVHRFGCSSHLISKRGLFLKDFLLRNSDDRELMVFSEEAIEGRPIEARMEFYQRAAFAALQALLKSCEQPPSQLIHVTCTGYVSPSSAQRVIAEKNWQQSTEVVHAYHMGCYAAFPALKLAQGLMAAQTLKQTRENPGPVRLAHTELCSLHFNPADHRPDQLVVQSLFADGAITYEISHDCADEHFEVLSLREEMVPDSGDDMTWMCSNWGMKMTLSKQVPQKIKTSLAGFIHRLLQQAGLEISEVSEIPHWAVHPGGPKILDEIQSLFGLGHHHLAASRSVLYDCGNMSSATLPHVWKTLLDSHLVQSGDLIISLAFGPGLTVCGGVFRKVGAKL